MTAELNAASNLADEINRAIKILESKNMFDESSEITESWKKTTKFRDKLFLEVAESPSALLTISLLVIIINTGAAVKCFRDQPWGQLQRSAVENGYFLRNNDCLLQVT